MNDSIFEKNMENVRKHRRIKLGTTDKRKQISTRTYLAELMSFS